MGSLVMDISEDEGFQHSGEGVEGIDSKVDTETAAAGGNERGGRCSFVGGAGSQFMDQGNPAKMSRSDLNDGGS